MAHTHNTHTTTMSERDTRLLACLRELTIHNAREIAHQIWKDGDPDSLPLYDQLLEAADRCEDGTGTDEDWDLLIEQTEM